jgi:hypothetical protein
MLRKAVSCNLLHYAHVCEYEDPCLCIIKRKEKRMEHDRCMWHACDIDVCDMGHDRSI